MTHQTQRKLFVGILGLGICVLVVDRLVLASGGPAPESDPYTVDASAEDVEATAIPKVDLALTETSLSARLHAVAARIPAGTCRDAFAVPASWRVEDAAAAQVSTPAKPASGFTVDYSLSAVMASESGRGFATLVSHKLNQPGRITLRLGGVIDGHKLVKIETRSAVFEGPEGPITLKLAAPETGRSHLPAKSDGG